MAVQGDLRDMSLPALVQLACQEGQRARLTIRQGDVQAMLYFAEGHIVHAALSSGAEPVNLDSEEVVYRVLNWETGAFTLESGIEPPERTIHSPWSALLMTGLQRRDEARWDTLEIEARSNTMPGRTTLDILKDFLGVPGVSTAVVVGRDGFVIEVAGGSRELDLDALGASLAHAIDGIETMGQELKIQTFRDLFVEYGGALIVARPVGDAILALVAADASRLGTVRHMIKPLVAELSTHF